MAKKKPTLKQLQETASDLNKYMDEISGGEYKNHIEINEDIEYLTDEIVQMVGVEIYKQDKDHLSKESISIIEMLGLKFEDLKDNPAQLEEDDPKNRKEETDVDTKESDIAEKKVVEEKSKRVFTRADSYIEAINELVDSFTRKELTDKSNEIYTKKTGKNSVVSAKNYTIFATPVLCGLGILEKKNNKYFLVGK